MAEGSDRDESLIVALAVRSDKDAEARRASLQPERFYGSALGGRE